MSMILYLRRADDEEIAAIRANPNAISDFFFAPEAEEAGDLLDFDKAWQGVHFTLTGAEYYTDSPLGVLLFNGEQIGVDMGYGPGWIVPSETVGRFNEALAELSDEDIRARYDPQAMVAADIYHGDGFAAYPEEGLQYLMQSVPNLRAFAKKCADTGSSVIAAIC